VNHDVVEIFGKKLQLVDISDIIAGPNQVLLLDDEVNRRAVIAMLI
jgi:hypothetical protein